GARGRAGGRAPGQPPARPSRLRRRPRSRIPSRDGFGDRHEAARGRRPAGLWSSSRLPEGEDGAGSAVRPGREEEPGAERLADATGELEAETRSRLVTVLGQPNPVIVDDER